MKLHVSLISDAEILRADEVLTAPTERPTATEVLQLLNEEAVVPPQSGTASDVPDTRTLVGLYDSPREREQFVRRCLRLRPPAHTTPVEASP